MYAENNPFNVASLKTIASDLLRLLSGAGTIGRLTPNGIDPTTGKAVRQTLEEMRSAIDTFLEQGES